MTVKFIGDTATPEFPFGVHHEFKQGLAYEDDRGAIYIGVDSNLTEDQDNKRVVLCQVTDPKYQSADWEMFVPVKHLRGRNFREISLTITKD